MHDDHNLVQIAFYELTRFSMDVIRRKREHYRKEIKVNYCNVGLAIHSLMAVYRVRLRHWTSYEHDHPESEEELCEQQSNP